ncbi:MAG: epoxyqueuosine reductase QueH [Actinobacteria bacterium]|nr:MAG: epoxyqueuosine reductase QueH [Actinomycetota bacterium]
MKVMLHACCGPCLLEPFDAIAAEHEVVVCYANPNIHPAAEYERRRDTLMAYVRERGLAAVELAYDPDAWRMAVRGIEADRVRRCEACFRLRLGMVAHAAADAGCDAVASTLTVSPYQDQAAVDRAGRAACAEAGVTWLGGDFRDRYPEATRRSRELGMYRQNYCGCVYGVAEAEADRAHRREERAAAKRGQSEEPPASE